MKKDKIVAHLTIYDCDDREMIESRLGVGADEFVIKNDGANQTLPFAMRTMWSYNSKLADTALIEEHITSLIDTFSSPTKKSQLSDIAQKYRTVIMIGAEFSNSNSEIEIDAKTLRQLSSLGVSLWFDMYTS